MSEAGRPRLHLTPRTGWLNDPLALSWQPDDRGGRYHLFFQHVPDSVVWAAHCVWGHATSTDLLEWQEQPVALRPAADEVGAWSGCLVEGRVLYTSVLPHDVERGRVRVAWPHGDELWEPGDVLLEPPADPEVTYFRDPFVVRDGDTWRMLVGAGMADGTGCVLGYRSSDLASWEPTGVVTSRHTSATDPMWTGSIWECPQLLRLPGGDVLVFSVADSSGPGDVVAAVGTYRDGRFEVATWQQLTTGAPYAASAFRDRDDRPGLLTWLRGVSGDGWAGAVGVPLLLTLEDGRVELAVHPALAACRRPWEPDAQAWDVEWHPQDETEELSLSASSGNRVAHLRATSDHLSIDLGGRRLELEIGGGAVRVLRDGPLLEVLTSRGLAAGAVPTGPLRLEGGHRRSWALA
jgi:beta-fructofuranosidase